MIINGKSMEYELTALLYRIFRLPEVNKVHIRDIDIFSADNSQKIRESIDKCYHDVLSDIDIGIHVILHPDDLGNGHGYYSNPQRIGLSRDNYLGLAFSDGDRMFKHLFRDLGAV